MLAKHCLRSRFFVCFVFFDIVGVPSVQICTANSSSKVLVFCGGNVLSLKNWNEVRFVWRYS